MGYYTDLSQCSFNLNKRLDDDTYNLLVGLNKTRRMKRNIDSKYGVEGEFYVEGAGFAGQDKDSTIVDYNTPPSTQPSLWCCWCPDSDRKTISGPEEEGKHYEYIEWLTYIISKILEPRGYILNGSGEWKGENSEDIGRIVITNNVVKAQYAAITYEDVDALLAENKQLKNDLAEYMLLTDNQKINTIKKLVALAANSDNINESKNAINKANELPNANLTDR